MCLQSHLQSILGWNNFFLIYFVFTTVLFTPFLCSLMCHNLEYFLITDCVLLIITIQLLNDYLTDTIGDLIRELYVMADSSPG